MLLKAIHFQTYNKAIHFQNYNWQPKIKDQKQNQDTKKTQIYFIAISVENINI